jgi:hypothetical protein
MTVVKFWVLAVALIASPVAAVAQQVARPADMETIRARQKISVIEGALERAVQNGASNFSRQIQAAAPNAEGMAMLMGAPVVRGFPLPEGLGVFFDVQMPSLQLSMVWPLRYQGGDPAAALLVNELRRELQNVSDPQVRAELNQRVRQLEQQLAGGRNRRSGATPVASGGSSPAGSPPAAAPPVSPADMVILEDPAEAWRREVRITLIDAMIENTGGVTIGPNEYIIVAARGVMSSDRLLSDAGDARTMELRLKGSDLAAYNARTITLEEARQRVVFREY